MKHSIQFETERINTLKKYSILDTPPDGSFDRITKLAAILMDVPIAIVSLVDTDRIWFKSKYGVDVQQIGRDPGLCASAILGDELYEIGDTLTDPRTLANPLVASEFGLRFYAAVPLKVKDGYNLGTLCVLDKKPRQLSKNQKDTLQYLADITIDQLELRLAARTAISHQNQMLNMAVHDLKTPLTVITAWAELAKKASDSPQNVATYCEKIKEASARMTRQVNELLESARKEAGQIDLRFAPLSLSAVMKRLVQTNSLVANNKNISIHFHAHQHPEINADEDKLIEVAENLINNAIKFSPEGRDIFIDIYEEDGWAILKIKDQGPGLTETDMQRLYQRFVKLSAKPTAGENSTGLGLSIVKTLVDAHHGEIIANSEGPDKGSTFTVKLPILV